MEKKRKREIKYRTLICSAAGAFFCGFGANWGSQLDRNGNVAVTDLYSWLIPFLTACVLTPVYPGFFAYDATEELQEVLTGQYVTRHPLLHVLMLGKTVSGIQKLTGSYNSGIGV